MSFLDGQPVPVEVEAIEQASRDLWAPVGETEVAVRAQAATLVVYTTERDRDSVDRAIVQVMRQFPGRAILIVATGDPGPPGLEAWITARCHPGPGRHVCGEQVTIAAAGEPSASLPSLVAALRLTDVPSYLWWAAPVPARPRLLHRLAEGADRLIIDSRRLPTRSRGDDLHSEALRRAGRLARARRRVGDLAWAATAPWRELIASSFDAPGTRPLLADLSRVDLSSAGPAGTAEALLTAGWLASRLGWVLQPRRRSRRVETVPPTGSVRRFRRPNGHAVRVELAQSVSEGDGLVAIRLVAGGTEFSLSALPGTGCARITHRAKGGPPLARAVTLPSPTWGDLLGHEMAMAGHDPVYEGALVAAAAI